MKIYLRPYCKAHAWSFGFQGIAHASWTIIEAHNLHSTKRNFTLETTFPVKGYRYLPVARDCEIDPLQEGARYFLLPQ